jgi:hypothetical protein
MPECVISYTLIASTQIPGKGGVESLAKQGKIWRLLEGNVRKAQNKLIFKTEEVVMKRGIAGFLTTILALAICFIFAGTGGALAEVALPRHSLEVGTEISYIKYEEPDIMEETGMMYGIVGSYAYHNNFMLKAEGKWSYGQVDYDGQLSDGTSYTIDNIDDYTLEFRGLGGYDFPVSETITITPYIGFGYRYLNDDPSFDVYGYGRESNYYYSPIGVEITTPLKNDWSIGATVEYDYFWKGIQKSHLEDFLAGLDTLENDQNKGYGIRGSIKFQNKGEKIGLVIEPYVRYWNIAKSKEATITYSGTPIGAVGWEPKNNSTEIGCKLAVKF